MQGEAYTIHNDVDVTRHMSEIPAAINLDLDSLKNKQFFTFQFKVMKH